MPRGRQAWSGRRDRSGSRCWHRGQTKGHNGRVRTSSRNAMAHGCALFALPGSGSGSPRGGWPRGEPLPSRSGGAVTPVDGADPEPGGAAPGTPVLSVSVRTDPRNPANTAAVPGWWLVELRNGLLHRRGVPRHEHPAGDGETAPAEGGEAVCLLTRYARVPRGHGQRGPSPGAADQRAGPWPGLLGRTRVGLPEHPRGTAGPGGNVAAPAMWEILKANGFGPATRRTGPSRSSSWLPGPRRSWPVTSSPPACSTNPGPRPGRNRARDPAYPHPRSHAASSPDDWPVQQARTLLTDSTGARRQARADGMINDYRLVT